MSVVTVTTRHAGAAVSEGEGTPWTSPGNVTDPGDATRALASLDPLGVSQRLRVFSFGFDAGPDALPTGAVVEGVTVELRAEALDILAAGMIADVELHLADGADAIGENKAAGPWADALTTRTYGGVDDLWGADLDATLIRSEGFGVILRVEEVAAGSAKDAEAAWVRVSVSWRVKPRGLILPPATLSGGLTLPPATLSGGLTLPPVRV